MLSGFALKGGLISTTGATILPGATDTTESDLGGTAQIT
jgi:hypothetical protein